MLDALSPLASPAVLPLPVRTPGGSAKLGLCESSFAKEYAHLVPRNAVTHSHQSLAEETRTLTIDAATELGKQMMSSMHR